MLKYIQPSKYYSFQSILYNKIHTGKLCLPCSNTRTHLLKVPRGTSGHSINLFSRSFPNSTSLDAINTYPVTLTQHTSNALCISDCFSATSIGITNQLKHVEVNEFNHWNSPRRNLTTQPLLSHIFSVRHYAKGKDRGGKSKKGKSKVDISPEEMRQVINGDQLLDELDELIENYKEDMTKAVAIRTNVGSLEDLPIELEGDTYPLNELAQVHRKSPTLVMINCSAFPQAVKSVITAIVESGMNLNPQAEGNSIAVPIPKVTREHREGLASKAKQMCNKCKDNLRQVHNNYVRKAKGKEGQVSDDTLHKVVLKIKELLDDRVKEAETILATKQSELLKS